MELKKNAPKNSEDKTCFKHSKVDELFNLVKNTDSKKVIICVGQNKVSRKQFNTFKQADEYIKTKPYELLVNVSVLIYKSLEQSEKEQNAEKDSANTQDNK